MSVPASADNSSSSKKTRDRIQQLSELRRGLIHYTDAQYGTADDPLFVMHIVVDGLVSRTVYACLFMHVFTCHLLFYTALKSEITCQV